MATETLPDFMKCISLWQPWASAIAVGAKRIETRSWPTAYRGPLLIHASKTQAPAAIFHEVCQFAGMRSNSGESCCLPLGAIIAVAELVDCRQISQYNSPSYTGPLLIRGGCMALKPDARELALGDYNPGRYGWVLANVRALPTPIPYRGRQGLFDVPASVLPAEFRPPEQETARGQRSQQEAGRG